MNIYFPESTLQAAEIATFQNDPFADISSEHCILFEKAFDRVTNTYMYWIKEYIRSTNLEDYGYDNHQNIYDDEIFVLTQTCNYSEIGNDTTTSEWERINTFYNNTHYKEKMISFIIHLHKNIETGDERFYYWSLDPNQIESFHDKLAENQNFINFMNAEETYRDEEPELSIIEPETKNFFSKIKDRFSLPKDSRNEQKTFYDFLSMDLKRMEELEKSIMKSQKSTADKLSFLGEDY